MTLFIAPTEPPALKVLGKVSSLPERHGVDVLFVDKTRGACGIQRKEFSDFLASVQDGRLTRELSMMRSLSHAVLLIEGRPRWSMDGQLMDQYARWSRVSHYNYLRSVMDLGVWVESSEDLATTVVAVKSFEAWVSKGEHLSLQTRPKAKGKWGKADDREFGLHLLQSFDGIGVGQAGAIWDHFGGLPLRWAVTRAEMERVKGIGKVRVEKMWRGIVGEVVEGKREEKREEKAG